MKVVSQFIFIMGLALAYRSPFKPDVINFINDIDKNLKGIDIMEESECFWRVL